MKRRVFQTKLYLLVVLASPILLSGCIPGGNGLSVVSSTEKSGFVQGAAVKNFPGIPVYPKSKLIESYTDGTNFGGSAYSSESLQKVVDFYTSAFKQLGWENTITRQTNNNFLIEYKSDKNRGEVIINTASDNKRTAITIIARPR